MSLDTIFDRPQGGERALLVHVVIDGVANERDLTEFRELARAAGADCVAEVTAARRTPDPRYFIGSGKVETIRTLVAAEDVGLVMVDHQLSPSQERNLERALSCRVVDRTGLILDIFAQRARSHEGKLQVELAQLRHLSTRLVRGWTHLERQKGGIGLRGPGETQLETDRRLLGERIKMLRRRLERVDRQRDQGRQSRRKREIPTVSLVGYTNAGKSTLFNRLTQSSVYAADQLFATLDPTLRRLELPGGRHVVLADTVGFVSQLPHDLVAAFRATLQETCEADLILHVVDASDPDRERQEQEVFSVLDQIGAQDVPRLTVLNKIDCMEALEPGQDLDAEGDVRGVRLSALTGAGIDDLRQALDRWFAEDTVSGEIDLPPSAGRVHARLYALGLVDDEHDAQDGGWRVRVRGPRREFEQWCRHDAQAAHWLGGLVPGR